MSSSNRVFGDGEKVELPVFATPNELIFSSSKRRALLTVFNPYGKEAQFRIMTTSPERFDVSLTKGTIEPNKRIDITIRLLSQEIDELPEPTEELQTIDYFRISVQIGLFKGNRPIKVRWCTNVDLSDTDESHVHLINSDDRSSKIKTKSSKHSSQTLQLNSGPSSSSHSQRAFQSQRGLTALHSIRPQVDHSRDGSNVNLICTFCAIACVIALFLPLALDSDLCKKAKTYPETTSTKSTSLLSQLSIFLSVSYEMKLGCSFALGLFTYRLISTLPD